MTLSSVGSDMAEAIRDIHLTARWRNTFRMCIIWSRVSQFLCLPVNNVNTGNRWLVYKIVDIVRHRSVQHRTVIATGILTNILVIISVLSAFPWIRKSV